jgi:hypothetical protein
MLNHICRYLTDACPLTPVYILQQIQAWNLTFMTEVAINVGCPTNTLTFSLFTHTKQNLLFNWALGTHTHTHTQFTPLISPPARQALTCTRLVLVEYRQTN